jgi:hypothetical protein
MSRRSSVSRIQVLTCMVEMGQSQISIWDWPISRQGTSMVPTGVDIPGGWPHMIHSSLDVWYQGYVLGVMVRQVPATSARRRVTALQQSRHWGPRPAAKHVMTTLYCVLTQGQWDLTAYRVKFHSTGQPAAFNSL